MPVSVLVVDDDRSIQKTVEIVLNGSKWSVQSAASGEEALTILADGFRGIVLLDIMMPELDGWQTLQAMVDREFVQNCIVCMLTAVHDPQEAMDPLKEFVTDYVRKPFTAEELECALDELEGFLP